MLRNLRAAFRHSAWLTPPRRMVQLTWIWMLAGVLLVAGCGMPASPATPSAPGTAASLSAVAPAAAPAPAATAGPATATAEGGLCAALQSGAAGQAQPEPGAKDSKGDKRDSSARKVAYDAQKNTITLGKGADVSLAAVSQAIDQPDALQEIRPGEWLLAANIEIEGRAKLRIAAPEVRWLKLRSDARGFTSIKALGGTLELASVCVTSWAPDRNQYDENYADGRSFVLARDGAQMTIRDSELSYLGYDADESYGLAWRLEGTSGEIVNSHLAHNFYGLYAYNAADLVIRNNEVHHSVLYGIDPHTHSRRLTIEGNRSHHNGKHGIILANGCTDSVIRNNEVYNNALHGIVLYQGSNNNVVEGNTSYGNSLEGIDVNDSSDNTIKNNTVYDNAEAGIGVGQGAQQNLVVGNQVYSNEQDGIALYSKATDNTIQQNIIKDNARYGIYIKSEGNRITEGNQVFGNAIGIYANVKAPPNISLETNQIHDNREADVRTRDE